VGLLNSAVAAMSTECQFVIKEPGIDKLATWSVDFGLPQSIHVSSRQSACCPEIVLWTSLADKSASAK
jgi:hypothetical protein